MGLRLELGFDMNNSAFDGCRVYEAARILHAMADRLQEWDGESLHHAKVMDENGNDVGSLDVCRGGTNEA